MENCPICGSKNNTLIYSVKNIPTFQTKIFHSFQDAISIAKGDLDIVYCECCFAWNKSFDSNLMNYDENYNNNQSSSHFFCNFIENLVKFFEKKNKKNETICEIACGQGFFLEKMRNKGFDIVGFDPAYVGNSKYITKAYFSNDLNKTNFDVFILRHVLEHIESPYEFLLSIAKTNNYKGHVYIEVPSFNWAIENNAFWCFFYEHVNYFSFEIFQAIFPNAEIQFCYGEQFISVYANLSELKENKMLKFIPKKIDTASSLNISLDHLKINKNNKVFLWGAGAMGSIFCNVIDQEKKIFSAIIDANPLKQNKFIAGTGHNIISPEVFKQEYKNKNVTVIVINQNYYKEIKDFLNSNTIQIITTNDLYR